jgi:hypothetical protein
MRFVDRETGEAIEDVADYLQEAYANSAIGILEHVIEAHWPELRTLIFTARANDSARVAQWTPVLRFIRSQAAGVAWSDGELTRRLTGIRVSSRQYRDALRLLSGRPTQAAGWPACLEEVAASRGEAAPNPLLGTRKAILK